MGLVSWNLKLINFIFYVYFVIEGVILFFDLFWMFILIFIFIVNSKCFLSLCRNGGMCEEDGRFYKCICLFGFEGSNCEGKCEFMVCY